MPTMRSDRTAGFPGIMAILLLAAGCAGTPARERGADDGMRPEPPAPSGAEPEPAPRDLRGSVVQLALAMVGTAYRYGGADPSEGFDCSGLVYYSYTANGHDVPRTSQAQFDAAFKISIEEAAKGDLLFFRDQEKLSHVGIYLGDGRFVHAPSSGDSVRVADLDTPYYRRHFVAVGRLLQ